MNGTLSMNAGSVAETHRNSFDLFALRSSGDAKTSSLNPLMLSYPLMPDPLCKSHLVKLSLPVISSSDCLVQLQQRQIEATKSMVTVLIVVLMVKFLVDES